MACFLVPVVEAAVVAVASRFVKNKEKALESAEIHVEGSGITERKPAFSRKLRWLSNMLWGGSALLAFEHVWHGEVVPWFPFLTAASDPAEAAEMLHEMATVGVTMAVVVTVAWLGMVAVSSLIEKRALKALPAKE